MKSPDRPPQQWVLASDAILVCRCGLAVQYVLTTKNASMCICEYSGWLSVAASAQNAPETPIIRFLGGVVHFIEV